MDVKPIRNGRDYEQALRRVEALWDWPDGSPENDELAVLATLIEAYERERFPMDLPDPIEAIRFRLEQQGANARALIGVIGQRTRGCEVLRGKRPLSLKMIRSLHEKFGIPAKVLIQSAKKWKVTSRRQAPGRSRSVTLKRPV